MSQLGTTRVLNKRISLISHIYILVIHYIFQIPLSGIYLERIGNNQRRRQATISHQHIVSLMCANRHVQCYILIGLKQLSGQTEPMRKGINFCRPFANFPAQNFVGKEKKEPLSCQISEKDNLKRS